MLIREGDLELNLLQGFDKSLQNVLAQTMVCQDNVFRNQVTELHRLYHTQMILMQEMGQKVSSQFHFIEECPNSFVSPFCSSKFWTEKKIIQVMHTKMSHSPHNTYLEYGHVPQICMPRHMKDNFLQDHASTCLKPEQKPNLELPVNFNTNLSGDILYDKCGRVAAGAFGQMKSGFDDVQVSPIKELELSLSINTETWKTCFAEKSQEDPVICLPSQCHANPKNFTENTDGDLVTITSPGYSTFSYRKLNLECSSCKRSRKDDGFYRSSRINSLTDFRTFFLDNKPAIQGVEQCQDECTCKVKSTRRNLFTSHEVVELDLNRALPEELSLNSIDHLISNSSKCTFSSLNRIKQEIKCSIDSSNSDQQEMMDSTWATSPSKDTSEVNRGSAFVSVELPSICEPPYKSEHPSSCTKSFRLKNPALKLDLRHTSCQAISMHEVNAEKHHDSNQELAEGGGSSKFPVSSKFGLISEDISSYIKKGGQCGIPMEKPPTTFQNQESSIPAKKLCQQSIIPSTKPKRKSQVSNQKNNRLPEADIFIKNGAVSLLYLSSARLAKNQDDVPCSIRMREISDTARDVPQCSSESYESTVLKQPEISLDVYSVTSTPSGVNCSSEKDHGPKLRRGRRMKDFRKEILPGLASLSRQEICEDVRILCGAMKSREYKYRSKMRGIADGSSPLKSKGSRHSHGRKR